MIGTVSLLDQVAGGRTAAAGRSSTGLAGQLLTAQIGPDARGLTTTLAEQFQGTPRDEKTPVSYRLMYTEQGHADRLRAHRQGVRARRGVERLPPGGEGYEHYVVGDAAPDDGSGGFGWFAQVPDGGRAVDFVTTTGGKWNWIYDRVTPGDKTEYSTETPASAFRAGGKYTQTFGGAILSPSVPAAPDFGLARFEDQIAVRVPLFTDSNGGAGRVGHRNRAKTPLFHNGTKLGERDRPSAIFDVPAAEGSYRAEMEHSRTADVSTKVSGAWTFKAKHTTEVTHLPLSVVRFLPKLDDKDTAHGRVLLVPLKVEQQESTPKVKRVTVEVSFDDGATWKQVPVAGDPRPAR